MNVLLSFNIELPFVCVLAGICAGSVLENPPVNPIVGHGRTQDDVRREKEAYHRKLRARAEVSGGLQPVFQADFLFIKLPQTSVQLHRVAHGLCIDDALQPELSFTTVEYKHTPQPGVDGFWGIFEPAENESRDATAKKPGNKFARHYNIGRDAVVMYNVQVP